MNSQFKYINQLVATASQVYYLTFMCGSTCFLAPSRPSSGAYNCINSLWCYLLSQEIL